MTLNHSGETKVRTNLVPVLDSACSFNRSDLCFQSIDPSAHSRAHAVP